MFAIKNNFLWIMLSFGLAECTYDFHLLICHGTLIWQLCSMDGFVFPEKSLLFRVCCMLRPSFLPSCLLSILAIPYPSSQAWSSEIDPLGFVTVMMQVWTQPLPWLGYSPGQGDKGPLLQVDPQAAEFPCRNSTRHAVGPTALAWGNFNRIGLPVGLEHWA